MKSTGSSHYLRSKRHINVREAWAYSDRAGMEVVAELETAGVFHGTVIVRLTPKDLRALKLRRALAKGETP